MNISFIFILLIIAAIGIIAGIIVSKSNKTLGIAIAVVFILAGVVAEGILSDIAADAFKPIIMQPSCSTGTTTTTTTTSTTTTRTTTTTSAANLSNTQYQIGDIITLGSYEQDGNISNGSEPLEWLVVDVSRDRALIVSLYALNVMPYNIDRDTSHTWEDCTLRKWLNSEFYRDAFSYNDRDLLLTTNISNNDNPDYGTDGGDNTRDIIFLLSIDEARQYLTMSQRAAEPTWYSRIQGNYADDSHDNVCWWWLRSVGDNGKKAAYVDEYGNIGTEGNWINLEISVRPAAYIRID